MTRAKKAKRCVYVAVWNDSVPNPLQEAERRRCTGGGMDAERGAMGRGRHRHGRPFVRGRLVRMLGWPSFWLLFLGQTRKSDSPSRAKPCHQTARCSVEAKPSNLPVRSQTQSSRRFQPKKTPCPGNSDAALRRPVTNLSAAMRTGYTHSAPPARLQTPPRPAHAWHRALAESRYGRCSPIPSPVGFQRIGPWHTIGPAP